MATKGIVIRVDGNPNMGLGHIYRGIALADMLKSDFSVEFVTQPSSTMAPVKEAGFYFTFLPDDIEFTKEPEWLSKNFSTETIVVLDGYLFKEDYQKAIKERGFKLVYIDDLVEYHMYADLVINHAPGIAKVDYRYESYTQFALGPKYAILRSAFLEAAKQKRTIDKIDTAFVCFGGSDIHDLTLKATKALLQINQIKKINIVIGAVYRQTAIFSLSEKYPAIKMYRNLSEKELLKVMLESDLAIVPASTILYEICAVKMPVLTGYYANNQQKIYDGFCHNQAVVGVEDFNKITISVLCNKVKLLIYNKKRLKDFLFNQAKLFDGNINKRYLELIKDLCYN